MKSNKIFIITYIEDETVEGVVNSRDDFKKWLENHNKERKAEGSLLENNGEFHLREVNYYQFN